MLILNSLNKYQHCFEIHFEFRQYLFYIGFEHFIVKLEDENINITAVSKSHKILTLRTVTPVSGLFIKYKGDV